MRNVSTSVKTGDQIVINGLNAVIGAYKKGLIEVKYQIDTTSVATDWISVKMLNKMLAESLPTNGNS